MPTFPARLISLILLPITALAEPILISGTPVDLTLHSAGSHAMRITLSPPKLPDSPFANPSLVCQTPPPPAATFTQTTTDTTVKVGDLSANVSFSPLEITLTRADGSLVQKLSIEDDGNIRFLLDDQPILGLGEGGPRTAKGKNWRKAEVEFDRRGRLFQMQPRWQAEAYGSRNPVPFMLGTSGWALFFASPWGEIDLSHKQHGRFLPIKKQDPAKMRQTFANQQLQLGKGIPPMEKYVTGLRDIFVFDARDPAALMRDISTLTGPSAMPPKWALGYMQSHRTLDDDEQTLRIVDTFRTKKIPLDAVIYLGTGFTPRGWNKPQPSFEFNPEVIKRDPADWIAALHDRHAKVVLHIVPWDRDRLPRLDAQHIASYWHDHLPLVKAGADGWWPDEGDWFDLHERITRHQLYYDGPISTQPDRRPWSLHRNGYLGIARWGGWVWSGDTDSSWKTLETQIAVGINHSLSLSPYWGTDIGGFYPSKELTGELYARWFQFGAFCPSFRAHGRTWWTRLPWGWGLDTIGPNEHPEPPDTSTLNDPQIENIARRYAELRYRLLTYNYTLAWQARDTGMPLMRALWLHYPHDPIAAKTANQYLWGRDLLIAPVFEKSATTRDAYLPNGTWFDLWTNESITGGRHITRQVDLATMPIYVRAGTILPLDPIRQYTDQPVDAPLTLRIYPGADGEFTLYDDAGDQRYLNGEFTLTHIAWNDRTNTLRISPAQGKPEPRTFRVELTTTKETQTIPWQTLPMEIKFRRSKTQ